MTKVCTKCNTDKPFSEFYKRGEGYRSHCKECMKAFDASRREAHPEKEKLRRKVYKANNKEKISIAGKIRYKRRKEHHNAICRRRYAENSEHVLAKQAEYNKKNPGKLAAKAAKRRAAKLQRTPSWSETVEIEEYYCNRPDGYHVDHIVPLQGGDIVSGLHVLCNLQYLLSRDNISKLNHFIPRIEDLDVIQ